MAMAPSLSPFPDLLTSKMKVFELGCQDFPLEKAHTQPRIAAEVQGQPELTLDRHPGRPHTPEANVFFVSLQQSARFSPTCPLIRLGWPFIFCSNGFLFLYMFLLCISVYSRKSHHSSDAFYRDF